MVETNQRPDGTWDVITPKGNIHAEIIVNAGGLWAREVGLLAGLHLPVQPMEHHYLITEDIPEIVERGADRLPAGIDYEGNIYFRQERSGMLLGTYEPRATPWSVDGTPQDFGHELLEPKLDNIADRLEIGFARIPALERAGIKNIINGPFTFGPDGNPMIGPVPGLRNYWTAVGVMAGFCQAGGVGLCMAEWMMDGEPSIDVWAMDVARFGDFATPDWGRVKSSENYERRFVMTFPNETLPKGRRQKTTALFDRLVAKGAMMDQGFGLENAMWFADGVEDAHEEPTFRRSRAHDYVAREVKAVREAVGCIEIANFAKHEFKGPGAGAFLDRILAGRLPKPGRLEPDAHADAQGQALWRPDGVLPGRGPLHAFRLRRHAGGAPPLVRTAPAGERRELPQRLGRLPRYRPFRAAVARAPVAHRTGDQRGTQSALPRYSADLCRRCAGDPVADLLFGEMGYEIYVAPQYQLRLAEAIEAAGEDLGLRWYGSRALMSLRLEKNWGAWTLDFRPDFTPAESGLDVFIKWDKDFIGKEAALKERETGPAKKLVALTIQGNEIDVSNDESILKDGEAVGYVSSGGYAHHVGQSMALGYVPTNLAKDGERFQIEILGEMYDADVTLTPLYDHDGGRMRN